MSSSSKIADVAAARLLSARLSGADRRPWSSSEQPDPLAQARRLVVDDPLDGLLLRRRWSCGRRAGPRSPRCDWPARHSSASRSSWRRRPWVRMMTLRKRSPRLARRVLSGRPGGTAVSAQTNWLVIAVRLGAGADARAATARTSWTRRGRRGRSGSAGRSGPARRRTVSILLQPGPAQRRAQRALRCRAGSAWRRAARPRCSPSCPSRVLMPTSTWVTLGTLVTATARCSASSSPTARERVRAVGRGARGRRGR